MKQLRNIVGSLGLAAVLAGCNTNPCQESNFTLNLEIPLSNNLTGKFGDTYCYKGREVTEASYQSLTKCPGSELKTDMAALDCNFEYHGYENRGYFGFIKKE